MSAPVTLWGLFLSLVVSSIYGVAGAPHHSINSIDATLSHTSSGHLAIHRSYSLEHAALSRTANVTSFTGPTPSGRPYDFDTTSLMSSVTSVRAPPTTIGRKFTTDHTDTLTNNGSEFLASTISDFEPQNTHRSFLESPQCTSNLLSYYNITAVPTDPRNHYTWIVPEGETLIATIKPEKYNKRTFTIKGPTSTVYIDSNAAATGGPAQGCCGVCSIVDYYVDINYWPQPNARSNCRSELPPARRTRPPIHRKAQNTANIPIPYPAGAVVTPRAIIPPRDGPEDGTGPVTSIGIDGFTYTSPYVYVVYESVWAENKCGYVGGMYTSLTWSFLPEQLSTLDKWGYTVPFDFADLPCRTEDRLYDDGYYHEATLAAVPQLNMIDPAYKNCWVGYWEGLDPPFAFDPQSQLIPTTVSTSVPTAPPAEPQSIVSPPAMQTGLDKAPRPSNPTQSIQGKVSILGAVPKIAENLPSELPKSKFRSNQGPFDFNSPASRDRDGSLLLQATNLPSTQSKPSEGHSLTFEAPSYPTITAFPKPSYQAFTFGHRTVSLERDSRKIIIGSRTINAGAPAVTMFGEQISLASDASEVVIGSSAIALNHGKGVQAFFAAGQTILPTRGNFLIMGETVVPGNAAITIDGTQLAAEYVTRNGPAGPFQTSVLVIGHETFALPDQEETPGLESLYGTPAHTSGVSVLKIGNQMASVLPPGMGIIYRGSTISPGEFVTVDGTVVKVSNSFVAEGTKTEEMNPIVTEGFGEIRVTSTGSAKGTSGQDDVTSALIAETRSPEAAVVASSSVPSVASRLHGGSPEPALWRMLASALAAMVLILVA